MFPEKTKELFQFSQFVFLFNILHILTQSGPNLSPYFLPKTKNSCPKFTREKTKLMPAYAIKPWCNEAPSYEFIRLDGPVPIKIYHFKN